MEKYPVTIHEPSAVRTARQVCALISCLPSLHHWMQWIKHYCFTNNFVRALCLYIDCTDCKTVRIFAYSSAREPSNKRSGARLKTESETGERRLLNRFWEEKPTVLQSNFYVFLPSFPTSESLERMGQDLGAVISGIVLVWHAVAISNACISKRSQKSLRRRLVPILLLVSGVGYGTTTACVKRPNFTFYGELFSHIFMQWTHELNHFVNAKYMWMWKARFTRYLPCSFHFA